MGLRELLLAEAARRGINQVQAAAEIGVGQQVFSRWVAPRPTRPSAEHCARIAAFLGVRRDDVMRMAGHWEDESDDPGQSRDPMLEFYVKDLRESLAKAPPERQPRLVEAFRHMVLAATETAAFVLKAVAIMVTKAKQKPLTA